MTLPQARDLADRPSLLRVETDSRIAAAVDRLTLARFEQPGDDRRLETLRAALMEAR